MYVTHLPPANREKRQRQKRPQEQPRGEEEPCMRSFPVFHSVLLWLCFQMAAASLVSKVLSYLVPHQGDGDELYWRVGRTDVMMYVYV